MLQSKDGGTGKAELAEFLHAAMLAPLAGGLPLAASDGDKEQIVCLNDHVER